LIYQSIYIYMYLCNRWVFTSSSNFL